MINSLQVFRGWAAIAVVLHHASVSTEAFIGELPKLLSALLGMGFLGVDFFFVLSGFIIMHAHMGDGANFVSVRRYISKRLWRIYPPYLPISLALVIAYGLWPSLSDAGGGRSFSLISSFLLVPSALPPALSVAWTLVHEMQFYLVFLLFYVSPRVFGVALMIWSVLILAAACDLLDFQGGAFRYLISPLNFEFMLGVSAAWLYRQGFDFLRPLSMVLLGLLFAGAGLVLHDAGETVIIWRLVFALGLMLCVLGSAGLEKDTSIRWPSWMMILGSASYSIYLIHNPLLSLTQRLAVKFEMASIFGLVFGVMCSVLLGVAYYWLLERPILEWAKQRRS